MPEVPNIEVTAKVRIEADTTALSEAKAAMLGITEPVDKAVQAMYVQADQDLFWLAEHGLLKVVSMFLRSLRRENEQDDEITVRLTAARDAAVSRANHVAYDYAPPHETVTVAGEVL